MREPSPRHLPAVAALLAVAACSDGDGSSGTRGDAGADAVPSRLGAVTLVPASSTFTPETSAVFVPLEGDEAAARDASERIRAALLLEPGTCVSRNDASAVLDLRGASPLDAGGALTFTDANGTYAGIVGERRADGSIVYEAASLPGTAPSGELLLDIPGGDGGGPAFPAASAVPFPAAASLPTLLSPPGRERVSTDTVFRWSAWPERRAGEGPLLVLVINQTDVIDDLMLCAPTVDGTSFTLPPSTIATLEARGQVGRDGSVGSLVAFGAMAAAERRVDEDTALLLRYLQFGDLP